MQLAGQLWCSTLCTVVGPDSKSGVSALAGRNWPASVSDDNGACRAALDGKLLAQVILRSRMLSNVAQRGGRDELQMQIEPPMRRYAADEVGCGTVAT